MTRKKTYGIIGAVLVTAVLAWAQAELGTHTRATNDPVFIAEEMLGRPTDTTITVNASAAKDLEVYYEYGTRPGTYTGKTAVTKFPAHEGVNVLLDNLKSNTQYYYRMQYREAGAKAYMARAEHSFWTHRPPGSTYTFAVQFDPHLDDNTDDATYKLSLQNMAKEKPDFLIDLGDNFFTDKLRPPTAAGVESRVQLMRSYYNIVNHSTTMFLALGGHEGEAPKNYDGTANNLAVWDTIYRKKYIPNPEPNGFYTSTGKAEPFMGLREANYSWEWGDAVFIILDPYWNRSVPPEQGTGDWGMTLGKEQYDWLKKTLETTKAKYKFVFSHSLIGGMKTSGGGSRGGIEGAKFLEMGGYNYDGTYAWDKMRPGWELPIHQLFAKNKGTIYFHGHDHTYVKQDLDGVVYQAGPQPSARNTELNDRAEVYKYTHGTILGGTGYIRVTVSPENVKVEYVETWLPEKETAKQKNGMIADSYIIKPR